MRLLAPLAAAAAAAASAASAAASLSLTGDAVLVLPSSPSTGVAAALRDVSRDWYRVTGVTPYTASAPPAPGSLPPGTTVVLLLPPEQLGGYDLTGCAAGWEAHCVAAVPGAAAPSGYDTVLATGSGDRGLIFAAYAFSELVLGVHPLHRFIDYAAPYTPTLAVNASMRAVFAPPQYTHRSIFPNDEDLLGGHRPDPLGRGVFSADGFDAMLETALRLKLNGVLVGTNPFPDDDNVKLVARRGLVVHHHHYNLLGSNVFQWPLQGSDWDWRKDAGTMAFLWRASIEAQAVHPEVVWSLGLRGLNDESYAACKGDKDCGAIITEVLSNQTAWLAAAGQANASRVLYLWQELLPLISSGDLVVPPGVDIIFADAGAGFINENSDVGTYAAGVYYHTAMYNGGANQLTEMVPVDRIVSQMLNFTRSAKATKHAVINLSDLRPVPMTTQAWAQLVWDPAPFAANPDPLATALGAYAAFGRTACGLDDAAAATFADMWAAYFAIPFIQGGEADNRLATALASVAPDFAAAVAGGQPVSAALLSSAQGALKGLGGNATHVAALAALAQAQALVATAVPAARAAFFGAHSVLNMGTIGYPARALYTVASAVVAYAAGGGLPAAQQAALAALSDMDALMALRRAAEYGQWAAYFMTDHLSDMNRARKAVRQLALTLAAPVGTPRAPLTPYIWCVRRSRRRARADQRAHGAARGSAIY